MYRSFVSILRGIIPCLVLVLVISYHPISIFAASAKIELSASSGSPGTNVQVTGRWFERTQLVILQFDGNQVGTSTTDENGKFRISVIIPNSALPGPHILQALVQSSGTSSSANFLVQTNWAMQAFDQGLTGVNPYENVLTPTNVSQLTLYWSTHLNTNSFSSPVEVNGIVYVGSLDDNIYALDATTGTPLWRYYTGSWVLDAPTVMNGVVYFSSVDHKIYALDAATGTLLWFFQTHERHQIDYALLTIVNNVAYVVPDDGYLYALNAHTGSLLWQSMPIGAVSTPSVANGIVYVSGLNGHLYALNAHAGTIVWVRWLALPYTISSPIVINNVIYISITNGQSAKIFALSAIIGKTLWISQIPNSYVLRISATAETLYVGSYDNAHQNIYALDARTGTILWNTPLGGAITSLVEANGVVFVGSYDHNIYALNATNGLLLWNYKAGDVVSSPIVTNGIVYFSSDDQNVYAFHISKTST